MTTPKILPIIIAPAPILRQPTKLVEQITPAILQLLDNMLATMYAAPGIGLAGPQVGSDLAVAVIDISSGRGGENRQPLKLINPKIVAQSTELAEYEEGCLSIPRIFGVVKRPEMVRVQYIDEFGVEQVLEADGLLATCLQHEIDHLNGVLFWDHLSLLKRNSAQRKHDKNLRLRIDD